MTVPPLSPRWLRRSLRAAGLVVGLLALSPSAARAAPHKPAKAQKKSKPAKGAKAAAPRAAPAASVPKDPPAPPAPIALELDVRRATLDNGLRVVIDVDHTSPTVAALVVYDVGARNEERGRSGFAHLFEHMMFQGSRNVSRGDHFRLVSGHGGVLNGTTSADRTNYFEVLPQSELALALWLEADRMRSLDVSQENFENQRKVVEEEYRMRVSNAAYEPSKIRLEELVYQGYWPYEHATIGSMADLDGAKVEWVQAFHAAHYGPNDAVLSIAGDVDPDAALSLAHRYFDDVAKVTVAPFADPGLPEQTSQRTAVVKDDHVRTPGVLLGWALPPARSADHYAIDLAAAVLADGESSRLHQLLVRDKALAQSISASSEQRRGPDLLRVEAVLAHDAKPPQVEALIEAEIDALATRGPTDAELAKAKRRVEAGFVLGLAGNLARARELAEYELYFGDARLLTGELPHYLEVTKDDVKHAVAKYLGPTRRTVVETYPTEAPADPTRTAAQPPAHGSTGGYEVTRVGVHAVAPAHASKKAAKPKKQKKP